MKVPNNSTVNNGYLSNLETETFARATCSTNDLNKELTPLRYDEIRY